MPEATTAETEIAPAFQEALSQFLDFVSLERGLASNTAEAYGRDLMRYVVMLSDRPGVTSPQTASSEDVSALLRFLGEVGLEASSVARNLTAVRMFHQFLVSEGLADRDPTEHLKPPKLGRKLPRVLSVEEVERLALAPDVSTPLGSARPGDAGNALRRRTAGLGTDRAGTDAPAVRPRGGPRRREGKSGTGRADRTRGGGLG